MRYDHALSLEPHPDVYPPSEDSILLVESLEVSPGEKVLEIGCGSGVVAIHCALNGCRVTAADMNPAALENTTLNAAANGAHLEVFLSDVYDGVCGRYDTIVFNLPYLPVEEEGALALAWSGGPDGLGPLPDLLEGAPEHLLPGGRLVVVVSSLMDGPSLGGALSGFRVRVLGELPLFFESLRVLEIRLSS
ncbi:MAG: methyltransferase [Candidatus Methanomethylophilaceae archaeon]|nr:methyltransferase [Candidatus Methanomethylophilaceae archaeon]NLF33445.1 methyltransferase [Thermoplasmatales archaeon]